MAWTNKEKKQLRLALLDVYRGYAKLKIFVADELGERLEAIAPENADLTAIAYDLIDWAESKGRLDDLYEAFLEENPGRAIQGKSASGVGDRQTSQNNSPSNTIDQDHDGSGDNVAGNKTVHIHYH